MATSEKKGTSTVFWWLGWIALTIVSFFVSYYFWTGFIAQRFGSMDRPGAPVLWIIAVFGTWLLLLLPLIVVMYQKVDKSYEDARLAREGRDLERAKEELGVRWASMEPSERLLPKALSEKLKKTPEAIRRGHLVTAVLRDGRRVENVFVFNRRDVLGVYGQTRMPFEVREVVDLEPANLDRLPDFKSEEWPRLDGAAS